MRCHYPGAHFGGFNLPPQCSCFFVKNRVLFFSLFLNSTSSCSHAPISIGRPSSYPPSTKGNPQVSDVSPLSLSTTPPEVSIGIHQEPITCTVAINFQVLVRLCMGISKEIKVPMITVDETMIIKITPTLPFLLKGLCHDCAHVWAVTVADCLWTNWKQVSCTWGNLHNLRFIVREVGVFRTFMFDFIYIPIIHIYSLVFLR